jgi:hypothetical protein
MKAFSVFSRLLLIAAAAATINLPSAPGQSGRGPDRAPRGPAPTLTHPSTPTKAADEEGFIRRWLVLEPIGANGLTDSAVQAAVRKEYFPNQFMVIPHDGDKINVEGSDLTWHAVDSKLYNINLYHFAYALGKPTSNVLFWAVTVVDCQRGLRLVGQRKGSHWHIRRSPNRHR